MKIIFTTSGGNRVTGEFVERIDARGQIIVKVRTDRGLEVHKFPSEDSLMRATGQPKLFDE